ncbi:hypothetical protein AT01_658 [Yersinia aldovae 670-83]|nr:hypothetical protein AT01_658 [Yersinia aldovae 670-83]
MVESMIGLLRQNKGFTQSTRCYEGFNADSQIPVLPSLLTSTLLFSVLSLFPVSVSCNHSRCDIVFIRPSGWMLTLFAFLSLVLAAKEARTSSVCETYTQNNSSAARRQSVIKEQPTYVA